MAGAVRALGPAWLRHRFGRVLFGDLPRRGPASPGRARCGASAGAHGFPAAGDVHQPVQALQRARHSLRLRRRPFGAARGMCRSRGALDAASESIMKKTIEDAWENRAALGAAKAPKKLREAVDEVIAGLDAGKLRVAEKTGGGWVTHQWIKKAVLLSF